MLITFALGEGEAPAEPESKPALGGSLALLFETKPGTA